MVVAKKSMKTMKSMKTVKSQVIHLMTMAEMRLYVYHCLVLSRLTVVSFTDRVATPNCGCYLYLFLEVPKIIMK